MNSRWLTSPLVGICYIFLIGIHSSIRISVLRQSKLWTFWVRHSLRVEFPLTVFLSVARLYHFLPYTHIPHPLCSKVNFHITVVIKNCPIDQESHPVGATVPPNGHSGTERETCQDSVKLSSCHALYRFCMNKPFQNLDSFITNLVISSTFPFCGLT